MQLLVLLFHVIISINALERGIAFIGESPNFQTNTIWGSVVFDENSDGSVSVSGAIHGLTSGDHGFHVHQYGDMRVTTDLSTLGFHFIVTCNDDPINNITCINDQMHGIPPAVQRHPGDMGNINANGNGDITVSITLGQNKMSLKDPLRSIIGRTVLIHSMQDLGVQPFGSAGGPAAFGVIGKYNVASNDAMGPSVTPVTAAIAVHTGIGSAGISIKGLVWLVKLIGESSITLYTNITGLTAGSYALGFYQYGHLTNDTMNYGTILTPVVVVVSSGPTQLVRQSFNIPVSDVLTFVGGMSVLFSTATAGTFSDVLSMGVVGLGNESVDFPGTSTAALSGYSFITLLVLFCVLNARF